MECLGFRAQGLHIYGAYGANTGIGTMWDISGTFDPKVGYEFGFVAIGVWGFRR